MARPRILVVDDDPDLVRMLDQLLRSLGDVETARDGSEALAKAKVHRPDVIVTDLMMPRMDGIALAKNLKRDAELATVPLVMLTAKAGARDVISGINAGARFYVTKPFKSDDLIAKVKKALGALSK